MSALSKLIWWIISSLLLCIYLFNFCYLLQISKLSKLFTLTTILQSFRFSKVPSAKVPFSKINTKNTLVLISKSSIQLLGISTFFSKKIRQEKLRKLIKIFELYQVFMYNFQCQNVLVLPNCILTMRTKRIPLSFNTPKLYQQWLNLFAFFSSSNMHQSHRLFGCHVTGINIQLYIS